MVESDPQRMLQRYSRLLEVSSSLASTLNLHELLNLIVHTAAELCQAEAASILLYDESQHALFFDATTNLDQPIMRGLVVPVESSLAGWIVTHREPVIIMDAQNDPRHFGEVGKTTRITTNSLLGVPLVAKDKVVGTLEAINKISGVFDQDDLEVLMALGSQAAVAIENARLFQQSDLISELVHELRTPLSSLNIAARLLQRDDLPEETRRGVIDTMISETGRLAEMTSAFLDLSRLESGRAPFNVQSFDILPLIQECLLMLTPRAQEKGVVFELDAPSGLPKLFADREKIQQLLINLLSNAIKYNCPNGKVWISANVKGKEFSFLVRDTGVGIPPESLPHLFEKFYRAPGSEHVSQGTGLGLSICKSIVEAHHGRIEVESQPGLGAQFRVFLPLEMHIRKSGA